MRKLILWCTSLCAIAFLISVSPVWAQSVLWVSASGNDANACSQTAPCATFQGAINKGNVVQINCLNSGNYGAFTITASITIDCGTGNVGNVFVSNNIAITINTISAATIILRHLSLNGNGTAAIGINTPSFSSGTLIVEDCTIQGFSSPGYGISFTPSAGRGLLQVSNFRGFGNMYGIFVAPFPGQIASVALNRIELVGNAVGLAMLGQGVVAGTIRDSLVGANGNTGVFASASQVYFTIEESSIIANLSYGIATNSSGAVLNVGASTIGGNGTGVFPQSGAIISFGNNQMSANGSNGNFTSTISLR